MKKSIIKGQITKIGYVDNEGIPHDWSFNCKNRAIGWQILENGEYILAGYSVDELKQISRKHEEGL